VTAGKPGNKDEFKRYEQDDWHIFVPQNFPAQKLQISYRSGIFGGLTVSAS